jgi:hypothetical protein
MPVFAVLLFLVLCASPARAQSSTDLKIPVRGAVLAATLTLPAGTGPHPGVVLLAGSGPSTRTPSLAFAIILTGGGATPREVEMFMQEVSLERANVDAQGRVQAREMLEAGSAHAQGGAIMPEYPKAVSAFLAAFANR